MIKKGKCNNIGVCLKAGKVFEIDIDENPFECPECHEPLEEVQEEDVPSNVTKAKKKKSTVYIIAIAVVLVAIIAGIFAFSGNNSEEPQAVVTDSIPAIDTAKVATEVKADTVVKRDTVVVRDTIVQNNTVTTSEKVSTKTVVKTTSPATPSKSTSGSVNLGYAKFTGPVAGGKPNGTGRMTFTSSHMIDSRDPKGRVAEAGDYVIGEWSQGKLVQGKWFGSDNNVKGSIIIGL